MPQVQVIQPIQQQPKRLRVAAYARVSSDSEDQLNSLAVQVDYYTHLIQENPNWEFAGIYTDEGITGTSTKRREQFNRLMDDCRAGLIDRVLVKSASRFARNTADTGDLEPNNGLADSAECGQSRCNLKTWHNKSWIGYTKSNSTRK